MIKQARVTVICSHLPGLWVKQKPRLQRGKKGTARLLPPPCSMHKVSTILAFFRLASKQGTTIFGLPRLLDFEKDTICTSHRKGDKKQKGRWWVLVPEPNRLCALQAC